MYKSSSSSHFRSCKTRCSRSWWSMKGLRSLAAAFLACPDKLFGFFVHMDPGSMGSSPTFPSPPLLSSAVPVSSMPCTDKGKTRTGSSFPFHALSEKRRLGDPQANFGAEDPRLVWPSVGSIGLRTRAPKDSLLSCGCELGRCRLPVTPSTNAENLFLRCDCELGLDELGVSTSSGMSPGTLVQCVPRAEAPFGTERDGEPGVLPRVSKAGFSEVLPSTTSILGARGFE
mmetsp:Transcript_43354/g.119954  ORF Transcript_43354/g.119954 Transcript_43354/m.119954 type:complete len:229 (+) Transcript_43354:467-1153(+)